jgi:RNA recognition motif-containing protein
MLRVVFDENDPEDKQLMQQSQMRIDDKFQNFLKNKHERALLKVPEELRRTASNPVTEPDVDDSSLNSDDREELKQIGRGMVGFDYNVIKNWKRERLMRKSTHMLPFIS